jgi:IPT/TIG domain
MKTKILIGVVVVLAVLVAGAFYFADRVQAPEQVPNIPVSTSTSTGTPTSTTPTSTTPTSTAGNYISPTSGPVGTMVTIHGSGFGADNDILMSNLTSASFKDVASQNGTTITFTIPSTLLPNCAPNQACPDFAMLVENGAFTISVVTNGSTQDVGTFTVTGGGAPVPQ